MASAQHAKTRDIYQLGRRDGP